MSAAPKKPAETTTCPWCSATVPARATTCPSCGASLREAADGDILGVTQVDPAAISRASRVKPGRLATWLGADKPDEDDLGGHVEPPSKEVREEMLRIELAAIDAELEAKVTQATANRDLPPEEELMADVAPSSPPSDVAPSSPAAAGSEGSDGTNGPEAKPA
jgi:hypothetical protein